MSEVSIQKLKLIVAKVRTPNTIDGTENGSEDAAAELAATEALEEAIPINSKSKKKNTKVSDD